MVFIASIALLMNRGGLTVEEKRQSFAVLTAGALLGLFMTEIVKGIKDPDMNIKEKMIYLAIIGFSGIFTGLLAVPKVPPCTLRMVPCSDGVSPYCGFGSIHDRRPENP